MRIVLFILGLYHGNACEPVLTWLKERAHG